MRVEIIAVIIIYAYITIFCEQHQKTANQSNPIEFVSIVHRLVRVIKLQSMQYIDL